jgi:2-oxoglutarate/2-oxoacid ferredoxin oxidoreductase subunit alpha
MKPFPKNLGDILFNYEHILVPELNNGQLIKIINEKYHVRAIGLNKIKGLPFTKNEIKNKIIEILSV